MLPFQPPFLNQNQVRGVNNPSLNQILSPTNAPARPNQLGFNNSPMIVPQMGGFHNQNVLLGSLLAQQQLIQGLQNNLMAVLSQQGVMPQFHGQQLNMLGGLQSPNVMPVHGGSLLGRPPLNQNPNQMTGFLPNGFLCSQSPNFVPNSQIPVMNAGVPNPAFLGNGNPQLRPNITNSTGLEIQIAAQNLQQPMLPCPVQNNQCNGLPWPQMNLSQGGGINFSTNSLENVASNNCKIKFNGPGKTEPSNMSSGNAWRKQRPFPRIERRGQQQMNERNTQCSKNNDSASNICKRPLAVVYDESEVQRWREARKRNFPTRTNIEKKLNPSSEKKEDMDSDAKVRRQQLKEILAKQAELGVPVAEIPTYLLEPIGQNSRNINPLEASNTHVNTRYINTNNKRGRFRYDNRKAKKQKFKNEESPSHAPVVKKRDPSLLRKLLNADIRRDKSQLLQAFRFMVLNSFFKNSPDKPLVFPIITGKDAAEPETGVVVANKLLQNDVEIAAASAGRNGDDEEIESDSNDISSASDVACESIVEGFTVGGEKSEEGEITD